MDYLDQPNWISTTGNPTEVDRREHTFEQSTACAMVSRHDQDVLSVACTLEGANFDLSTVIHYLCTPSL
jgi:hypothetical protein